MSESACEVAQAEDYFTKHGAPTPAAKTEVSDSDIALPRRIVANDGHSPSSAHSASWR